MIVHVGDSYGTWKRDGCFTPCTALGIAETPA